MICPAYCEWFPLKRKDRFPSVDDRVKLYMHKWYQPCNENRRFNYSLDESGSYPVLTLRGHETSDETVLDAIVDFNKIMLLDKAFAMACAERENPTSKWKNAKEYILKHDTRVFCADILDLLEMTEKLNENSSSSAPVVTLFGDILGVDAKNHNFPLIGKWRHARKKQDLDALTSTSHCEGSGVTGEEIEPIVWRLESNRHWDPVEPSMKEDIPWEQKRPSTMWRGDFTGVAHYKTSSTNMTDLEHCLINQRCRFVYEHLDSTLIDAGIANTVDLISPVIEGKTITKTSVDMRVLQEYKIIISFEGNDVASGLKWSLFSQSVVLMPQPTRTSWAMEELLEPWVHYIPMKEDGSDADAMVQWVIDNDEKAKEISQRASLFIYDLLFHPLAEMENRATNEEIARRYHQWWA
jgi:hypothetical protein